MTLRSTLGPGGGGLGAGLFGLAFATMALTCSGDAGAYCIARPCNPDSEEGQPCVRDARTGCASEGPELFRPSGCVYFGVQKGAGPRLLELSDAEFNQLIDEAFEVWESVDCGDGPPSIMVESVGPVSVDRPFTCSLVPDLNVDVWMLSSELWNGQVITPNTGQTAAATRPTFDVETGEILDADVRLNEAWLLVQSDDLRTDHLRVVALHEAGHALGLAHSVDENALMHRNYSVQSGHSLTQDDIDGICALYPPRSVVCAPARAHDAAFSRSACDAAYEEEDRANGETNPDAGPITDGGEDDDEEEMMPAMPGMPVIETTSCGVGGSDLPGMASSLLPVVLALALPRLRRALLGRRGERA